MATKKKDTLTYSRGIGAGVVHERVFPDTSQTTRLPNAGTVWPRDVRRVDTSQTNTEPVLRYDVPLAPGISDLYAMGANTVYPQGEYSKLMK